MTITFPKSELYDDSQGVRFPADVDGERIVCVISKEALESFGSGEYMKVFRAHRTEIEALASRLVELGRVAAGMLLIRLADAGR